jgi:enoyl-CoA hydratase
MKTHVTLEYHEHVAYLTFSSEEPDKPPVLDYEVLDELEQHLKNLHAESESLVALIVQSDSPKYFNVGANLQALKKIDKDSISEWIRRGHKVFDMLEGIPVPVIAKVTGYALGGGLELAMACDFIVSSQNASFGQPETRLGVIPGWGGSYRLPRRIGEAKAKELIFTGKIIPAEEAYRIGLVNFVGTEDELEEYVASTIQKVAQNSRLAISLAKRLVKSSMTSDMQVNYEKESLASSVCLASNDTQQRLKEFLRKNESRQGEE